MPEEKTEYSPFELAKQLHEERLAALGQEKQTEQENLEEGEMELETENMEPNFIAEKEQPAAAGRLGQMKETVKQQAKKIAVEAGKKAVEKVASAVWKKVAARVALFVGPYILAFLGIITIIIIVVTLTLYLQCEVTNWAGGIFKPILSLVGITCDIPAGTGAASTTNSTPAATP